VHATRSSFFGKRRLLYLAAGVIALCGSVPLAQGAYLQAKASVAQVLLQRAWSESMRSGVAQRPWPWADTTPIAQLRVPRLAIEQIILSGDSGRSLAFAPGWTESSTRPGERGLSVISAHRDTHFAFLRDVMLGEVIEIETTSQSRTYHVVSTEIIDSRTHRIDTSEDSDALLFVTCYPFDALAAQGPLRYVVSARPVVRSEPSLFAAH
jgi:sortase A